MPFGNHFTNNFHVPTQFTPVAGACQGESTLAITIHGQASRSLNRNC